MRYWRLDVELCGKQGDSSLQGLMDEALRMVKSTACFLRVWPSCFTCWSFVCQATLRRKSGRPEAADEALRMVKPTFNFLRVWPSCFTCRSFVCQATLRRKSGRLEAADEAHRLVKSQSASFASAFMVHMSVFCLSGHASEKARSPGSGG
jgi:hypothetical protein